MFSCSPSFLFGKDGDFLSAKNTFPEASGNAPPTFKCFPKLRKTRADGKMLSETSENPAPTEKLFPKLRETPRRRKSTFRNSGKPRGGGKMLSETSGNSAAAEKYFPKLRETPRRRENAFRKFGKPCHAEEIQKKLPQ